MTSILSQALLRTLAGSFLLYSMMGAEAPVVITRCADIRALTREQAAERRPVLVQGVITYVSAQPRNAFVVHDSEGIYVASHTNSPGTKPAEYVGLDDPRVGMRVEIQGVTVPGGFAPSIAAQRVRWLGEAPLPTPKKVALSELRTGVYDSQQVEMEGVVQRMHKDSTTLGRLRLEVATEDGTFSAFVADSRGLDSAQLVDAALRLRGTCFTFFNTRGEAVGIHVQVARAEDTEVLTPAGSNPFSVPEVAPIALRPFRREAARLHRQRLTGVVTLCRPGEFCYVQMRERGVRVNTRSREVFVPGDVVDASGFIEATDAYAVISEAVLRKTGRASVPKPLAVTRTQILGVTTMPHWQLRTEDYDGSLVTLRARLVKIEHTPQEPPRIYLDSEGALWVATLPTTTPAAALQALLPGSDLEVTGICIVRLNMKWPAISLPLPQDFSLLLRGPEDLRVLRSPSWWTPARLGTALGITAVLLVLALVWVQTLRRLVAERNLRLAAEQQRRSEAEIEFRVVLQERERLAADLHDTLEQSLTGLAFQVETLKRLGGEQPAQTVHHLELASQMLARSRDDVRRSVWNLCTQGLGEKSLRDAIRSSVAEVVAGTAIAVECGGSGEERPLPGHIASHLLLIAGEAVTNALKHAKPRRIQIAVDYGPEAVALSVSDDGNGFDLAQAAGPHQGHFGLQGMRERARRLGAELQVTSKPGQGTGIAVKVPITQGG
jgi:signal transduction histidine kinase